jgi:competence CoiA-like predicted nuclease
MLTAIDSANEQIVFIDDHQDCLDELRHRDLRDIIFNKKVFVRRSHLRKGSFVRSHFVSQAVYEDTFPDDVLLDPEYVEVTPQNQYRCNESIYHIAGKQKIYDWALNEYYNYPKLKIIPEYRVPIEAKGNKYRIVDVALIFPCGSIIAIECQLSPISLVDLKERFYDYQSEGIDSIWFLGNKASTSANVDFIANTNGEYYFVGFDTEPPNSLSKETFK